MSDVAVWLDENELRVYEKKFKESGIEKLNDLGPDVLEDDEEIREFIRDEIGETDESKANKIYNAIHALQVQLASATDMKESSNNNKLDKVNDGFDVREIVKVENGSDIEKILSNKHIKNMVVQYEKRYYNINVRDAMIKLETAGDLLQLAYASSNGFSCQAVIVNLLSRYASLVKETNFATGTFVGTSITSLGYHKTAFDVLPKDIGKAIKIIGLCCKQAKEMALLAETLEIKTVDLISIAEEALKQAVQDKSLKEQQRTKLEKSMKNARALRDELQILIETLRKDISKVYEFETDAVKQQFQAAQQFALQTMKTAAQPILEAPESLIQYEMTKQQKMFANDGDKKDNEDEKKQSKPGFDLNLIKQKNEILDKFMQQNDQLMSTIDNIKTGEMMEDRFQKSLNSIDVVIKTLGKIKSIFSNVQLFWIGVMENCNRLTQIYKRVDIFKNAGVDYQQQFKEAIINSAKGWFTLTKVNYDAKLAINRVDNGMDAILQNLPTEKEALKLVDGSADQMVKALTEENKAIKAAKQKTANFGERMQKDMDLLKKVGVKLKDLFVKKN